MDDPEMQGPPAGAGEEPPAPEAAEAPSEPAPEAAGAPSEPAPEAAGAPPEPPPPPPPAQAPPGPAAPPPPPPGPPAEPAAGGAKPLYKQPVFAIAALALLVGSIVAGNAIFKREAPSGVQTTPAPSPSPSPTAPATKEFRSVEAGITFKYPADWSPLSLEHDPDTTIAAFGTDQGELVKLDVYALQEPATTATIASPEVQERLAKIVAANESATITLRELKTVNGRDAWHFRTQFTDAKLGVGVHDIWFFFSGVKLEKLLFQAFPISEYNAKYRQVFDEIVGTYHTVPRGVAGSAPPPAESPAPSPAQ